MQKLQALSLTDGASQMIPEWESAIAFLPSPGDEGKMGVFVFLESWHTKSLPITLIT